jgi:hypothetical protein
MRLGSVRDQTLGRHSSLRAVGPGGGRASEFEVFDIGPLSSYRVTLA